MEAALLADAPAAAPFRTALLRLRLRDETQVAAALERVAAAAGGAVALGSYPVSDQADDAGIVLSLESRDGDALAAAAAALRAELPPGSVLSESRDSSAINTPAASPPAAAALAPAGGQPPS